MAAKGLTKGSGQIACADLPCRQLIQQGLELVVVVLVDEREPHVGVLCQIPGASESSKAPAHNHNVKSCIVDIHCEPPSSPSQWCIRHASVITSQSVRSIRSDGMRLSSPQASPRGE